MIPLDYSLKTSEERTSLVQKIVDNTPKKELTPQYLNYLTDYILFVREKNLTGQNDVTTRNRNSTINKREIYYQDVVNSLEGGEDSFHNLIRQDKVQLLDRKEKISENDLESIPQLKSQFQVLEHLKQQYDKAPKDKKYGLKKQIIETWQQIYMIKSAHTGNSTKLSPQMRTFINMDIPEKIYIDAFDNLHVESPLTLLNPDHISFLLNCYHQLKQESYDNLLGDMRWLLIDLENLIDRTFNVPGYFKDIAIPAKAIYDLIIWRIDGETNDTIVELMRQTHNIERTQQYYSTLWRQKIPRVLAEVAQKEWLMWHFTNQVYSEWKRCSQCGEYKPIHPTFFDRNPSGKDGYYSICKDCRSVRRRKRYAALHGKIFKDYAVPQDYAEPQDYPIQ